MPNLYQSEIFSLLKLEDMVKKNPSSVPTAKPAPLAPGLAPSNLPVADFMELERPLADQIMINILAPKKNITQGIQPELTSAIPAAEPLPAVAQAAPAKTGFFKRMFGKGIMIYPIIFAVSFAFFYVLFNFSALVSQVNAWFAKPQEAQILGVDEVAYFDWMNGYYFAVSNKDLLQPNNDVDSDGLTNHDEFIMRTNPLIPDSDNDGISDGVEILNSSNPWGSAGMNDLQKTLLKELDLSLINNRINFNTVASVGSSVTAVQPKVEYDLNKPGRLSVPKLSLQVPLIWTKSPNDFDADLTKGVVHYPGTAMPGEQGTSYISGHSSDFLWKHNEYKNVFTRINTLNEGDDIFVDIYGVDGKTYTYRYRVTTKNIYKPDDQTQFIDNTQTKLNLSTCWPIGTAKDRYVVSAVLAPL